MNNLKFFYIFTILPNFFKQFKYKNYHQIPKLKKIVINSGLGLNTQNKIFLKKSIEELRKITGQQPVLTYSKVSIANFKIRKNMPLGIFVTLRRKKMYAFLEKLIKLVFPRIRDFNGLNPNSFDNFGNYNLGINDQFVFPELLFETGEKKRGFNITIVTSAQTKKEGFDLLKELGIPFSLNSFFD